MDIIFLQFPNKTMEIPPLGTSILVGELRAKGIQTKQYDLNVEIKDLFLKEENLNFVYSEVIPTLLKMDLTDDCYSSILALYNLLKFIMLNYSFSELEDVKNKLQYREYLDVFREKRKTILFENLLKILSLSSALFETLIIDKAIEEKFSHLFFFKFIDEILEQVVVLNPKVIGISVVQQQRKISVWVAERIRKKYGYCGVLLFGGSDITYYKEKYLEKFYFIDFAIYQEGEYAVIKFIQYVYGKINLQEVPNLIYREGNIVKATRPGKVCDFSEIIPDFSDLKRNLYLSHALPMQVSRGCTWGKCSYCKHFRTYSKKFYSGNINKILKIIKSLVERYKTNLFHFVDDDFPRKLKNDFSKAVLLHDLDIRWLTYSRLDNSITAEDLKLWYNAGLRVVEWGLESASQRVLDSVDKGISIDNVKSLLFVANEIGLLNKLFMFHNLPKENYEDLYDSIQFLKKFVQYGIVRVFWEISTPLELLEGTLLYEQAQTEDLFDKIFEPRGLLEAKAGYIHQYNYQIKQDIFNNELVDDEEYYKQQGILNVNDEAIMFDVIIDELSKVHPLYARIRL